MAKEEKIRVLVADDHPLIREGLCRILSLEPLILLVGQVDNGRKAVDASLRQKVDVILMDINMPEMNGIEACQLIKKRAPHTKVIALTIHEDENYLFKMIRAGISAFLLKDVGPRTLLQTVKRVARGEYFIQPKLVNQVFQELNRLSTEPEEPNRLTKREMDVLRLVAQGENNRSIAGKLFISEKTVKNHLTNIFQKLDVTDRTQAALYAIKNKIVNP